MAAARGEDTASCAKRDLRDLSLDELEETVVAAGERAYRARQIAHWLYRRNVDSIDTMRDLPAALRTFLNQRFRLAPPLVATVWRSSDGTRKLLVRLADGEGIETVVIPAGKRITLCMSSQVGCAMRCAFCATARMGLHRNLSTGEIISQIVAARRELGADEILTNYVFMGMGEPRANYPGLSQALKVMTAPWGMAIPPGQITV